MFDPNLPAKQRETLHRARDARIAVWEGAVRSAKTVTSLIAWAEFVQQAPPGGLLMAGRTSDTLRRNVVEPLVDLFGERNVRPVYGSGLATMFGRPVFLVGADNSSAESRIRGVTLAGAYVDELTILGGPRGEEWWGMLLTRLSVPGAKLFATTNPAGPSHWLLTGYLSRAEVEVTRDGRVVVDGSPSAIPGLHRYRFTLDDNPTLTDEYKADLSARLSGLFRRRFIDGDWVAAEGAIFPMLDDNRHTVTGAAEGVPVVGVDWGVSNPTHAVAVVPDVSGQQLAVVGECRLTDKTATVAAQAKHILAWIENTLGHHPRQVRIVVDPSAKALRNELKTQAGRWPEAADNAVLTGISAVGSLLGTDPPGLVFVDGTCPHLWRELVGYVWDGKAEEAGGQARPVKRDDHGPDALRYAVMALRPTWVRWRAHRPAPPPKVDELFLPDW